MLLLTFSHVVPNGLTFAGICAVKVNCNKFNLSLLCFLIVFCLSRKDNCCPKVVVVVFFGSVNSDGSNNLLMPGKDRDVAQESLS